MADRQTGAVVEVRGLIHRYGSDVAVDDVSLDLPEGVITGIFGPDGVGKSTLMALIAGARQIQHGRVDVLGGSMRQARHRNTVFPRIAFMPQGLGQNLYMALSVRENLDFFGRLFGQDAAQRDRRIDRLLKATRLDAFPDRPVGKLSGGMKQKLGLCCALIHDPDLLILDEPTTGIDPCRGASSGALIEEIRDMRPKMSVFVSTAYMDEAENFDCLHAMHNGASSGAAAPLHCARRPAPTRWKMPSLLWSRKTNAVQRWSSTSRQDSRRRQIAIEAEGLTRRFGDFTAVDDVSFRIEHGEIFGFLGSNGSGKTTTMKMLTGLLPVSEGAVSLFGHPVDASDIQTRERVGYMSQSFSLYGQMSVRENLRLHARLYRLDADEIGDRIDALLDQVGLNGHDDNAAGACPWDCASVCRWPPRSFMTPNC